MTLDANFVVALAALATAGINHFRVSGLAAKVKADAVVAAAKLLAEALVAEAKLKADARP